MTEMKSAREIVLSISIGDILNELEEGMRTANASGSIQATVKYANQINAIEGVVDMFTAIEKETGIYSEGIK